MGNVIGFVISGSLKFESRGATSVRNVPVSSIIFCPWKKGDGVDRTRFKCGSGKQLFYWQDASALVLSDT